MTECIFCKIIAGEIPGDFVYRGEQVSAFRDINPVAPTHILVVPNQHIESIETARPDQKDILGELLVTVQKIARQEGVAQSGYRLIINNGPDAHQEVPHLHIHIIGGQKMKHPMG